MKIEGYAEFKPSRDMVEVTLYWKNKEGVKMRQDIDFPMDFFFENGEFEPVLTLDLRTDGPHPKINFNDR